MLRLPSLAAAALAATACGPLDVSVPVCKTLSAQQIPAAPAGYHGTFAQDQTLDVRDQLEKVGGSLQSVELRDLTLIARSGISDFAWLDSAQVVLPSSGGPELLVDYRRPADTAPSATLTVAGKPTNVLPQISAGPFTLHAEVTGTLPTTDWSADERVCLTVTAVLNSNAR